MWGFLLEEGDNDNEEEETSMNSWPKLRVKTLLPLALAVVMVAGSWAGVASYLGATAVGVNARSDLGTRADGDLPTPVSAKEVLAQEAGMEDLGATLPSALTGAQEQSPTVSPAERVDTQAAPGTMDPKAGITPPGPGAETQGVPTGTRGDDAIQVTLGPVDAGGPWGGPTTYEGDTLTLTATTPDPSLVLIRWDFNGDGVWDHPTTGWSTDWTVVHTYLDNYYGDVLKVEAWDGFSTSTILHTGVVIVGSPTVQWIIYPANQGYRFTAKVTMTVTELGFFTYFYGPAMSTRVLSIWRVSPVTLMGSCSPPAPIPSNVWKYCTLGTPLTLTAGQQYVVAIYKGFDYYPYMAGINTPADTNEVDFQSFMYDWGGPMAYPNIDGGTTFISLLNFKWSWTEIIPLTATDTAFVQVNNVAPIVFDATASPSVGLEGSDVSFTAKFTDPGTDDTWQYMWEFGDGTVSPWFNIGKFDGGADVLALHTWGPYWASNTQAPLTAACGSYCT